jgi:Na+-driven multidrug efflux pump
MSAVNNLFFGLIVVIFIAMAVATFYLISKNIGSNDNKQEVATAIKTIITTNSVLVLTLGLISYVYIRNSPSVQGPYTIVMLHVNFLLSLTAISIAALVQLSPPSS